MLNLPSHNFIDLKKLSCIILKFFRLRPSIIIILLVSLFSSCRHNYSKERLANYITNPNKGLVQEKVINGTIIRLTYKPSDLMAMQEIKAIETTSRAKIKEIQRSYSQQYYFQLSISLQGQEILHSAADREWFSFMVNKLSFGMNEYVSLVNVELDTLKLLTYNYPRMYGMSTSTDMLFVFERNKQEPNDILTFKLEDFGIFTGDVKFKIKVKDINRVPQLRDLNRIE